MGRPKRGQVKQKPKKIQPKKLPEVNPAHNENCKKCRFSNDERVWVSHGTCNFLSITGIARMKYYKAKNCPGFPGKRERKPIKELAVKLPRRRKTVQSRNET